MAFYDDAILAKGILIGNGVAADRLPQVARPALRPVLKAGDTPRSSLWGHLLVVFNKSPRKQESLDFAKYLIGKDVSMRYFNQNGMPPVLKTVLASPDVQNDPWMGNWSKITATGELSEYAFRSQSAQIQTIISEEIQACLTGSKTPQRTADDMASRLKAIN
jgi:multiple sugar transport system substrate-binding protein